MIQQWRDASRQFVLCTGECYCFDGVTRLGHIRGKMRKKVWVSAGDIVLVGLREYQDDKAP